jgi:hypothetical protein
MDGRSSGGRSGTLSSTDSALTTSAQFEMAYCCGYLRFRTSDLLYRTTRALLQPAFHVPNLLSENNPRSSVNGEWEPRFLCNTTYQSLPRPLYPTYEPIFKPSPPSLAHVPLPTNSLSNAFFYYIRQIWLRHHRLLSDVCPPPPLTKAHTVTLLDTFN